VKVPADSVTDYDVVIVVVVVVVVEDYVDFISSAVLSYILS
jgi:hypothetical protein